MAKVHDAVVLVPGLFGFGSFESAGEKICYFDQVVLNLARFSDMPAQSFVIHEPGPAESFAWRVSSLFERVTSLLRGSSALGRVERVHLIGHSTGGVDVRLLMNARYCWPGGPTGAERAAFFPSIGAVMSLSAPQWGSPIARRLRGALEGTLPNLYLASILAKHNRFAWTESLLLSLFMLGRDPEEQPARQMIELMARLPQEVANDVTRFIRRIVDDHELIHELTPLAMARLNRAIADAEWPHIRYYVTAAPHPALASLIGNSLRGEALRASIYATSEQLTRPSSRESRPFPSGPWLGSPEQRQQHQNTTDGVVSSASQTLHGVATAIVQGDHLDVVGHYESQRFRGISLFRSGSHFDDRRFDLLWCTIARELSAGGDGAGRRRL